MLCKLWWTWRRGTLLIWRKVTSIRTGLLNENDYFILVSSTYIKSKPSKISVTWVGGIETKELILLRESPIDTRYTDPEPYLCNIFSDYRLDGSWLKYLYFIWKFHTHPPTSIKTYWKFFVYVRSTVVLSNSLIMNKWQIDVQKRIQMKNYCLYRHFCTKMKVSFKRVNRSFSEDSF